MTQASFDIKQIRARSSSRDGVSQGKCGKNPGRSHSWRWFLVTRLTLCQQVNVLEEHLPITDITQKKDTGLGVGLSCTMACLACVRPCSSIPSTSRKGTKPNKVTETEQLRVTYLWKSWTTSCILQACALQSKWDLDFEISVHWAEVCYHLPKLHASQEGFHRYKTIPRTWLHQNDLKHTFVWWR